MEALVATGASPVEAVVAAGVCYAAEDVRAAAWGILEASVRKVAASYMDGTPDVALAMGVTTIQQHLLDAGMPGREMGLLVEGVPRTSSLPQDLAAAFALPIVDRRTASILVRYPDMEDGRPERSLVFTANQVMSRRLYSFGEIAPRLLDAVCRLGHAQVVVPHGVFFNARNFYWGHVTALPPIKASTLVLAGFDHLVDVGGVDAKTFLAQGCPQAVFRKGLTAKEATLIGLTAKDPFGGTVRVGHLSMKDCAIQSFPDGVRVSALSMSQCRHLESIPDGVIKQGGSLWVVDCAALERIPGGLAYDTITIKRCPQFRSFPKGIVARSWSVEDCPNWDGCPPIPSP